MYSVAIVKILTNREAWVPIDQSSSGAAQWRFPVNPVWLLGGAEVWGFQMGDRIVGRRKTLAGAG